MMSLFASSKNFPIVNFLAPCQVKVHWESSFNCMYRMFSEDGTAAGGLPATIPGGCLDWTTTASSQVSIEQSTVRLTCDFVSLPQELTSQTIEKNLIEGRESIEKVVHTQVQTLLVYNPMQRTGSLRAICLL